MSNDISSKKALLRVIKRTAWRPLKAEYGQIWECRRKEFRHKSQGGCENCAAPEISASKGVASKYGDLSKVQVRIVRATNSAFLSCGTEGILTSFQAVDRGLCVHTLALHRSPRSAVLYKTISFCASDTVHCEPPPLGQGAGPDVLHKSSKILLLLILNSWPLLAFTYECLKVVCRQKEDGRVTLTRMCFR